LTALEVLAVRVALLGAIVLLALSWGAGAAQAGVADVDRGFGDEGALMLSSRLEEVGDTTLLPDGRIVVAGYKRMMALLPSGQLDTGFGDAGLAPFALPPGATSVNVASVSADAQGRLVVAGNSAPPTRLLLERYSRSGQIDRGFGDDGFVSTDLGLPPPGPDEQPTVLARYAALDGRDRILLSGIRLAGYYFYKGYELGSYEPFLARFAPAGAVDPSFGSGGVQRLPGAEAAGAPAPDAGGGVYFATGGSLVHLRDDGAADPGFGENGGRPLPKETGSNPVLDPFGRLLTYGYLQGWKEHRLANGIVIKRLLPDGSPDRSFGGDGAVAFRLPRLYTARIGVDERGGVLVAAALKRRRPQGVHPALPTGLALARLRPGGNVDAEFGRRGIVSIPFPRSREMNLEGLDVGGGTALLAGTWCAGRCGHALARVDLGS
jgi:uncharacterized delta-60 repeat protein